MKALRWLTIANTVLVTAYFGLQVKEQLKQKGTTMPINEEQFKRLIKEQLGPEFLQKVEEVQLRLAELRSAPVSVQSALKFLQERKEIDPILKVNG